jgi:hypothetical protein
MLYLICLCAGLIFSKTVGGGAMVGVIVGVLVEILAAGFGVLVFAAIPQLLAMLIPQLVLEACLFGLAGAVGGLIRGHMREQKA